MSYMYYQCGHVVGSTEVKCMINKWGSVEIYVISLF